MLQANQTVLEDEGKGGRKNLRVGERHVEVEEKVDHFGNSGCVAKGYDNELLDRCYEDVVEQAHLEMIGRDGPSSEWFQRMQ